MALASGNCRVSRSSWKMCFQNLWTGIVFLMMLGKIAYGQSSDPVHFYLNQVKPLLTARCYACHTQSAMGGLRLDSREGLIKGGNSGATIVSGPSSNSLL